LGITLPALPSTLPKRTISKRVLLPAWRAWHTISARRLVAPITLVGFTALSVETNTNFFTPQSIAARATTDVPSTLLRTASHVLVSSMSGTCLYAAAWNTRAGEYWCITWFTRRAFLMSPTMLATGISGNASRSCSSSLYIAYSFIS
jgi:hypothetical protein